MKFKFFLSLPSLIFTGFVISAIPLGIAVIFAAIDMREISAMARTINYQVFEQSKAVYLTLQKTAEIERKAKLFVLLSDPAVRQPYEQQSYENTRALFQQALSDLLKLHINNKINLLVNELSEKENLIYQQVMSSATEYSIKFPIDEAFQGLRESSSSLAHEFESHIDRQSKQLFEKSNSLEQGLLIKGLVLLLASFIFITSFLTTLSDSLRQLTTGIRRLATGELQQPIHIKGYSALCSLGKRLEWLRKHLLELQTSNQQLIKNLASQLKPPIENLEAHIWQLQTETNQPQDLTHQSIAQQLTNNINPLKKLSEALERYRQICARPLPDNQINLNMQVLLDEVLKQFQTRLQAQSLTVKKQVKPVQLFGIKAQLQSIIEELMSNAVNYSPKGAEIRIMLRDSDSFMELEIEDEGPGIEPDDRLQVFEAFFRGKNLLASDTIQGSGLGLTLVKHYVDNHRGTVTIMDSKPEQTGVRILIQIPLTKET